MAIHYLSGVEAEEIAEIGALFKKGALKKVVKKVATNVKKAGGKVVKAVVKVAASPVRGMFLLLCKFNVLKLGDKITKAIAKDRKKIADFWEGKFKGKMSELEAAAKSGAGRAEAKKGDTISGIDQNGAEVGAVSVAAALATATPIIIAVLPLLKDILGKEGEPTPAEAAEIAQGSADFKNEATAAAEETSAGEETPFYKKPAVLIGGAAAVAAAVYFATKKK